MNTTAADTPGVAMLEDSLNKQSTLTLDSFRANKLRQRMKHNNDGTVVTFPSNLSLDNTPKTTVRT